MSHPQTNFTDCTLYITRRSPFARRVRVALIENAVPHHEIEVDVWNCPEEYRTINPLGRVPAVVLCDGTVLLESHLILEELYAVVGAVSEEGPREPHSLTANRLLSPSFFPADANLRRAARYWSAIAAGLCDKTIEFYIESLRPESQRDSVWIREIDSAVEHSLARLEGELGRALGAREAGGSTVAAGSGSVDSARYLLGDFVTQADFDLGVALDYLSFRYSDAWKEKFPLTRSYLERLSTRESFLRTRPA